PRSRSRRLHLEALPLRTDPRGHFPPPGLGLGRDSGDIRLSEMDALAGHRPDLQIDLVEQLSRTVERANDLLRALEGSFTAQEPMVPKPAERIRELEHRLSTTDSDVKELA